MGRRSKPAHSSPRRPMCAGFNDARNKTTRHAARNVRGLLSKQYCGLVIIDELNIVCVSALPGKADPPLDVYANTVASSPATLQRFQPVARRRAKIAEFPGVMQEQKLTSGDTLDRAKPLHGLILEQLRGVRAAKRAYQSPLYYVSRNTSNATPASTASALSMRNRNVSSTSACRAWQPRPRLRPFWAWRRPSRRADRFACGSSAVT